MEPNETAVSNTSPPSSNLRQRDLKAAQVRLFYAQSGIGSAGALLGALILGGALWKVVSHDRIVFWLLAYFTLFMGRYYLIRCFNSQGRGDDEAIKWGKWHGLAVNAGGLLWGVAGVLLFPQDSILHQFLLSFFVAGIVAAGAVIYSPTKDYVANVLLGLVPLSGRFFYELDEFHVIIGGVILLFACVLLLTGRKMHRVYADSLRLGYDKEELVKDLKDEIVRRDRLEAELKTARDDLEVRVEERIAELQTLNRTLEQEIDERKRADEALKQSEDRLSLVLSASVDGFWDWDLTTGHIWRSPGWTKILGYSLEETEPDLGAWDKLVHPDDLPGVIKVINDHLAGLTQGYTNEYRILKKTGEWTWIQDRGRVVQRDSSGNPRRVAGAFNDISHRKSTEMELRESEERFRSLFESSLDGILLTAPDGTVLKANRAACQILGWSEQELREIGRDGVVDQTDPRLNSAFEERGRTGRFRGELNFKRMDGTTFPVEISSALFTTANGDLRASIIVRDITERKRAEEELRDTVQRFYTILSNMYAGVLLVTDEGRLEFANQAFCDLFDLDDLPSDLRGLSPPEMIQKIEDVYAHPAEAVARIQAIVAQRRPVKGEEVAIRDGKTYMRDFVPLLVDGKHYGRLWHHQDITERKRAEEERESIRNQLVQFQKMESIGTLTGGIAHDFNNLLTIINGYTELVLSEKAQDDPGYSDLQKVLETGRKGAELVQSLLALSKKGESNPQPLDLNRTVENAVALMKRTFPKMIEIETILGKDLGMVNADASQVEQVLMNLCINAREAMPDGGKLTIETKNANVDEADCKPQVAAKPGPHVLIEVTDTGAGMDAGTLDRLFDPFFTTKGWDFKKGTGLSLPVAKGIAEQHRGWITCASEPGKGTTFRIYLPAIAEEGSVEKPGP